MLEFVPWKESRWKSSSCSSDPAERIVRHVGDGGRVGPQIPPAAAGGKGERTGADALALAEHPDRFLATVQIGITLIGTLAGAVGGATIAPQAGGVDRRAPPLAPYADAVSSRWSCWR